MAITFVKSWVPTSGSPNSTHTLSGPATEQGSTLIAVVKCRDNTSTVPVITDAAGNAWTHAQTFRDASQSTVHHIFYALNAEPITQITYTIYATDGINVPVASHGATLAEFKGVLGFHNAQSGTQVDVQTGQTRPAPTVTGTPAGALVFATASAGVTNRALTPGVGYTELPLSSHSNMRLWRAWQVVAAGGSVAPEWTLTTGAATSFGLITATFTADPNEGGPLTVNVGADQTISASTSLSVAAAASGGSGARTFAWTIQSGPPGDAQLLSTSAASTTFDPSGTPGVYVLRCTVTDASGSAHDEVTVTALRTLTFLPIADVLDSTGWTANGGTVKDVLSDNDDDTGITSGENPTNLVLDVLLAPLAVPDQPLQLRLRPRVLNGGTATVVGRLYTGTTLRATSDPVPIVDTYNQVNITFPLSALTAITATDWEAGVRATFSVTAA